MAKRAGAHITDIDAGHLSLISEPSVVTHVSLQATRRPDDPRADLVFRESDGGFAGHWSAHLALKPRHGGAMP